MKRKSFVLHHVYLLRLTEHLRNLLILEFPSLLSANNQPSRQLWLTQAFHGRSFIAKQLRSHKSGQI